MTAVSAIEPVAIPDSHLDLLTRPVYAVFTTIGADGWPQSSLVWVDFDGTCPRIKTTLERQKERNLLGNPKVNLLSVDPDDTSRYLQIQGDAEIITDSAIDHVDELTRKYTTHPVFYGLVHPAAQSELEKRVICRIHPRRISTDAIFSSAETREGNVSVSNTEGPS